MKTDPVIQEVSDSSKWKLEALGLGSGSSRESFGSPRLQGDPHVWLLEPRDFLHVVFICAEQDAIRFEDEQFEF